MRINRKIFGLVVFIVAIGLFVSCSKKRNDAAPGATAVAVRYHCPMHPNYISEKPGQCPICGMTLVPIENDDAGGGMTSPSQAPARVSSAAEQQIGINLSTVEKRDLFVTIKAPSRVAYDPNLYSAMLEYQEALKNKDRGSAEGQSEANLTLKASKLRLRQLGLSDEQIAEISNASFDPTNLLVGKAGGKIWIYVDIYDYEAGSVKTGQSAEFTSPAFPGKVFKGTVRALDSIVNSETRTLRARVEVDNPNGDLKPEMYLSATIHASLGKKLAVPDTAVLDTGMRQLVYVQSAPGVFEPREIKAGRDASGFYEVVSGLREGEQVVTSANFLIDSESKIRTAAQAAGGGQHD